MPCPVCSHTLQLAFMDAERTIYHCPRCGLMRSILFGHVHDTIPALVERCRAFEKLLVDAGMMTDVQPWRTLGLAESIHPEKDRPEDRPQGGPR